MMRTIRMAVIALCTTLAACDLYFDDKKQTIGQPDARVADGGSHCDNGSCGRDGGCEGPGCYPDAQVEDGGCNGVDCYPDAGVADGGCHGGDGGGGLPDAGVDDGGCNGVDCYPDAGYPDAHH